ncbi:hypothetical protein BKA93DRAFT_720606, partial [Sparassis latifolia]
FDAFWSRNIPVKITDVDSKFQGVWGPEYFVAQFGDVKVTLQDCKAEIAKTSTVGEFFKTFGNQQVAERATIMKLKDWPPEKHFSTQFPELFKAFMDGVPYPDLARLDGVLNLAAHFPQNGIPPDLGPKMYNAHGLKHDNLHHGSTKLHIDITDAVNVLLWAADTADGELGGALWHIFPAVSAPEIRRFLTQVYDFRGPGDPIHSHSVYFTPEMLNNLEAQCSIKPYVLFQRPGEAVFISASSPHQVSNQTDAIKIACDFISIANLAHTQNVVDELREQRLLSGWGDDVLQFYTTLWYAWTSV